MAKDSGRNQLFAEKGSSILFPKGSGQTPNPIGSGADGWFKIYMNQLNLLIGKQKQVPIMHMIFLLRLQSLESTLFKFLEDLPGM
jgi:hypothetical protein